MRIIRNKEECFSTMAPIPRRQISPHSPHAHSRQARHTHLRLRSHGPGHRAATRASGYDGQHHPLTQGDSVTIPANTRRRLAPATIMTLALLGSLALLVTFVLQVAAAAPPRGMDDVRAELLVALEEDAATLTGENPPVKIQADTLEILDRTADGAVAFAFLTADDRLGFGVRGESPDAYAWQLGAPTEKAGSLNAALTDTEQYEFSVRRSGSGNGFEHTFTQL